MSFYRINQNYNIRRETKSLLVDSSANNISLKLPKGNNLHVLQIKKISEDSNSITIEAVDCKIENQSSYQFSDPNSYLDLISIDGNWFITDKSGSAAAPDNGNGQPVVSESAVNLSGLNKKKPTIVFLFDDTAAIHYDTRNDWISRGFRFTTGVRLDFVDNSLTFAKLREMQDEGFEIAYHGTTGAIPTDLEADIASFLDTAKKEKLNINGYIGVSGTYDENIVFHKFFDTFKWARGSGATNGVANVKAAVDYFKHINASNSFIDDLTSTAALTTLKTKIDTLATRGTGIMTLSMHLDNTKTPYIPELLDYIKSKNIEVVTVSEAYETYGAIFEYYDSSLIFGEDFTKRISGNGSPSVNASTPHFVIQKDGTIISNGVGVKRILPIYKGQTINGNTLPDSFDVGVSIVQYGSTDNRTGFPTTGTLYNFNHGKNAGEQFQLFKAYNKGGLYYREATISNTWKTGMTEKLGIYRAVPASPTAAGAQGDFSADANYLYICYADNAWIRVAKDSTWV